MKKKLINKLLNRTTGIMLAYATAWTVERMTREDEKFANGVATFAYGVTATLTAGYGIKTALEVYEIAYKYAKRVSRPLNVTAIITKRALAKASTNSSIATPGSSLPLPIVHSIPFKPAPLALFLPIDLPKDET